MVDLTPQWPGSRFKKKTNHGGILDFWRHVTEYFIQNFKMGPLGDFEKKLFLR